MMEGRRFEREAVFGARSVEQRMNTTDMHGSVNRAVWARKYLRANAAEPLGTARLAALLGCSPRLLQLSYKAVFGRTVQEDIAETRLDLAKKLLNDSGIPICAIPERIGFESPGYFMEFFKARTGMTMLQWRRTKGAR